MHIHVSRTQGPRRLVRVGQRVQEVLVAALVDQRAEPTVLLFEQFAGLVEFDLDIKGMRPVFFFFQKRGRGTTTMSLTMRPASKTI